MSSLTSKLDTSRLRAQCERIRARLPVVIAERMKTIAAEAVEQIDVGGSYRGGRAYNAIDRLRARFVPVTLKHIRREQWPDVAGLYYGRVPMVTRRGVKVNRVWVDSNKLDALRTRIIARIARQLKDPEQWRIAITADEDEVRVSITKQGRASKSDLELVAALTRQIKAMFAEHATAMLYAALAE